MYISDTCKVPCLKTYPQRIKKSIFFSTLLTVNAFSLTPSKIIIDTDDLFFVFVHTGECRLSFLFLNSSTRPETPQPLQRLPNLLLKPERETTIWSKHLSFLPFHYMLFLCLYLGFPPVLSLREELASFRPVLGALSVILLLALHHCPRTLPVPFPLLRNGPRFARLTQTSLVFSLFRQCFYFFSSHLFLNPLFPKLRNVHCMSLGASNKSVLCFRNSLCFLCLLSWDFPQGRSSVLFLESSPLVLASFTMFLI